MTDKGFSNFSSEIPWFSALDAQKQAHLWRIVKQKNYSPTPPLLYSLKKTFSVNPNYNYSTEHDIIYGDVVHQVEKRCKAQS
ncbi:hypothetical protein [Hydrocoleum sp. CS-953]|uniref:hypothetical protein n=1 Tax=Microcoleaceae TaxID=1892252 RepID=UPI000B9ABD84|nr:hypothetical protein [Hydrocoleum sp. CS-953]OZH51667.1 hypothetical protein AFK68_29465 [Hydrocoleum sp. CS-953]